jgi:hypothetical protein
MAWSGGIFSRVRNWAQDKLNAINPQAALFDQEDDNFATGLNNCVTKDGLNKPSATMDWNAQRLTALGDATGATDALNRQFADARYLGLFNTAFLAQRTVGGATQSMPASTNTDCVFQTETDSGTFYDNATGIFTAPNTGWYQFSCGILLVPGGTNCVLSGIYFSINNATAAGISRYDIGIGTVGQLYSSSGNNVMFSGAVLLALTGGQTVRVKWSAGTSGAGTNAMGTSSYFSGVRLV